MMVPFHYATRNLLRQPWRLVQITTGIALVVAIVAFAAAFSSGMQASLATSGDPKNVILLGSGSEESVERSEVSATVPGVVAGSVSGLAMAGSEPAVSPEVYYNGMVTVQGTQAQAILRGVTWQALAVHQSVRLIDGNFPGPDEIMVGARTAAWLGIPAEQLALGETISFEGRDYRISGHFVAPQTVLEAELWLDLNDLMAVTQRDTLSSVVVRMDTATAGSLDLFATSRLDLEIVAIAEDVYYQQLGHFFQPIRIITWVTAILVALGAIFGGLNTMYAAIASRSKEMATLQAIGFRRWMLLISLMQEAAMTGLLGAALGIVLALYVIDGQSIAFSTGVFALLLTPETLVAAMLLGLGLALVGTLPPAIRCLYPSLSQTLRG